NKLLVIGTLTLENSSEASMEGNTSGLVFWEQKAKEGNFPLIRIDALSEPLVREHIQSLLGEQNVTDEFVRWMLWESAGSPLNIRRIIDYLITHDHLQWAPSGWSVDIERLRSLRIPSGAASILLEKVEALAPRQRAFLEVAATCGEVSAIELLTRISDLEPEETYRTIRELAAKGLLDESADGKMINFPQIQLRDAVYNTMNDRRRTELHLRVGNALEAMLLAGESQLIGQIAYHFARANDAEKGIHYSVEAGDIASRTLAHAEATEFYRSALELMDLAGLDEGRKAEVREKLADAYYRSDDYRSAMQSFQFLLKSVQARHRDNGPNADVARVMKKIGKVLTKRGEQDAALSYFQSAQAIYEKLEEPVEVAELLNRMAWLYKEKDDLD